MPLLYRLGLAAVLTLPLVAVQSAPPHTPPAASASSAAPVQFDLHFLTHMIHHHQQAVTLARLVPQRSQHQEIRLLAELIARNQTAEIELFRHWHAGWSEQLRESAAAAPRQPRMAPASTAQALPQADAGLAGGKLTLPPMPELPAQPAQDMAPLVAARGTEFDRLFLLHMITHHEGAIDMSGVALQRASQPQLRERARRMIDEQRDEIVRMRKLLQALPSTAQTGG